MWKTKFRKRTHGSYGLWLILFTQTQKHWATQTRTIVTVHRSNTEYAHYILYADRQSYHVNKLKICFAHLDMWSHNFGNFSIKSTQGYVHKTVHTSYESEKNPLNSFNHSFSYVTESKRMGFSFAICTELKNKWKFTESDFHKENVRNQIILKFARFFTYIL